MKTLALLLIVLLVVVAIGDFIGWFKEQPHANRRPSGMRPGDNNPDNRRRK